MDEGGADAVAAAAWSCLRSKPSESRRLAKASGRHAGGEAGRRGRRLGLRPKPFFTTPPKPARTRQLGWRRRGRHSATTTNASPGPLAGGQAADSARVSYRWKEEGGRAKPDSAATSAGFAVSVPAGHSPESASFGWFASRTPPTRAPGSAPALLSQGPSPTCTAECSSFACVGPGRARAFARRWP